MFTTFVYMLCYDWTVVSTNPIHTNSVGDLFLQVVLFTVPVTLVTQHVSFVLFTCQVVNQLSASVSAGIKMTLIGSHSPQLHHSISARS